MAVIPASPAPAPSEGAPDVQNAAAPAPASTPPAPERPWFTFPPFPKPPPGVELISFKNFKPVGIQLVPDAQPGHVEVDGLGIPTLTLRVHHDLTMMEKRKRKNKRRVNADGTVVRLPWYEEWAESENLRRLSSPVDPSMPRSDRLHQAAHDFKTGRSLQQMQELTALWDRFRLFIGLISSVQPPAARKREAALRNMMAAAAEGGDDGDEEEDEMPNAGLPQERTITVVDGEDVPDVPGTAPKVGVKSTLTEEQREQRREYYREVRDTRMDRFLNDPEKTVKIFLTGYASDRGMLGSEKFCRDGPILLNFFLNFLLRNRVFAESEKDIRKAIAVTELAKEELPHMFTISRAIPEGVGEGCKSIYGTMDDFMIWLARGNNDRGHDNKDISEDESEDEDAREAKRQKQDSPAATAAVLQAVAGENIEVISPDVTKSMEQDMKTLAAEEATLANANEPDAPAADGDAEGVAWGNNDTTWDDPWGATASTNDWTIWPKQNPLCKYIGPTALPLTHTTGLVERSTRRIKSVIVPMPLPAQAAKKGKKGSKSQQPPPAAPTADPEAVERELDARLAKVTLAPWHEWAVHDKADVQKPRILPDSRGAAVTENTKIAEVTPGEGTPHDPYKDDITVYVEPGMAQKFVVGMAVEALWVQLARVDPSVSIEVDPEMFDNPWTYNKKRGQGGPGVPVAPTNIWYLEQAYSVLPSFHTEMIPLPTTEDIFGEEA